MVLAEVWANQTSWLPLRYFVHPFHIPPIQNIVLIIAFTFCIMAPFGRSCKRLHEN
jgi:hypothetical protein